MKDQLISFETAILAKDRGFNVPTMAGYDENGVAWYPAGRNRSSTEPKVYKTQDYYTLAPTQSLLARWLREVHKIYITIHYNKSGRFNVSIEDECENSLGIAIFGEYFNSYEEALEEGLLEGLNSL